MVMMSRVTGGISCQNRSSITCYHYHPIIYFHRQLSQLSFRIAQKLKEPQLVIFILEMQRKIQQQTKTIQYIKDKYKQKTGEEIVMPKGWEDYLCIQQDEAPAQPLPQYGFHKSQTPTFLTTIDKLNLPSRLSYSKPPLTSFSPANKFHMIETIDLSNFKDTGFNKNSLREFLSRIVDMRCLKMVNLSRNGLGEECAEEIDVLLGIKRIIRIDLSKNEMGKTCLQIITKNFGHLEWIDISRNAFLFQNVTLNSLLSSLRVNAKIYHMQMDWQDPKMLTTFVSYLKIKPHLRSLGPVDSRITPEAMDYVCQVLNTKQSKKDNYRLNSLNFDYCYLDKPLFANFTKIISGNLSLIRLILSNNHLGQEAVIPFLQAIESNLALVELSLAGNLLQDEFARALGHTLCKNQILQIVDISKNNIGPEGGSQILRALTEGNDTVQSLGTFESNQRVGSQLLQKIKRALRINRISRQVRSKILSEEPDLPISEIANRQTEAFLDNQLLQYELLQPLIVTNPLREDPAKINIWKFA